MRPLALREGTLLRLATLGLMVAFGPAAAHADPPMGPRTPQRSYEVKPGDTLNSLARKHGITVATIVKANRLPGPDARLRVGQRLVIPVVETTPARRGEASAPSAAARPAAPARLVLAVPDFDGAALAFAWPVEGPVISTFGQRRSGWHGGIDIKAPPGTPVWAAAGGVVIASGVEAAYGLVVKIEHRRGFVTVYAHNDVNLVEVGDRIDAGEMIALVGQTGRATTPHVHFEIRREGLAYNPLYLLPLPPRIAQIDETAQRPHE